MSSLGSAYADLRRLQFEALKQGIHIHRAEYKHIEGVMKRFPEASTYFNCTGLGAFTLGGVEDQAVFAARVSHKMS